MIITQEQIAKGESKQTIKALVNGGTGTGKTYFGFTCPKVAYICTEPNGLDTARANANLIHNLVWADEFIPSISEDIKVTFDRMEKSIQQAHEDNIKGIVDTLFLDNFSYLAENRWIYIQKYESNRTSSGAIDTRGNYGVLARWLYNFTLTRLLSFKGNVIVTCHEQTEGEEAMEAKTDKSMTIQPSIIGGFRDKVAGMFSASIYLFKKRLAADKYLYYARCQQGDQRLAKNRYGLPEIVENVSFNAIHKSIGLGANKDLEITKS